MGSFTFLKKISHKVTMLLISAAMILTFSNKSSGQLPPHFYDLPVATGMKKVEGVVFDHKHRMYAWEKPGRIWIIDTNGVMNAKPLLSFTAEVGSWVDHGLNGFALDPDFEHNGYFYVYYNVDRHYLINYGTPQYSKDSDEYFNATIARITRYTADSSKNFNSVVPGSRTIIIGADKKSGIPVTHMSHSACGLVFGTDGTLLIPTGDGAAYGSLDNGNGTVSYWAQALIDSIITPEFNVGAFRSQMANSINGKILRIDPLTGNGVPSNPYYDSLNPGSVQSKVWCMGLRNPFKIAVRPGSGSTNPADAKPGVIYIGDVGWATWEELNIVTEPGQNFGWPIYEGMEYNVAYKNLLTPDYFAPNPLYGSGGCTQQYFYFQNLLMQATLDSTKTFKNPCDTSQTIPASVYTFIHKRPALDYRHDYDSAMVGIFNGNDAASIIVNDSLSPCKGETFGGDCIIGGGFYNDTVFPSVYKDDYYFGEFEDGYIKRVTIDSNDAPVFVDTFADSVGGFAVVHIAQHPVDGSLIYVKYPDEIRKICYACIADSPPVAVAIADTTFGSDSLSVNFDGSNSHDPDHAPLTYLWDFGDGYTSSLTNPQHLFTASAPGVLTVYTVVLSVTDDSSHTATDTITIVLNNTSPQVSITSFNDGDLYSILNATLLPLEAIVSDAEQSSNELFYFWQTTLHLNGTDSVIATDTNKISSVTIQPLGCFADTAYYTIMLTVTDLYGLIGFDQKNIYPDCNAPAAGFNWMSSSQCENDTVQFTDTTSHYPTLWQWTFTGGNPVSSTLQSPVVHYPSSGNYEVTLIATNAFGSTSHTDTITINSLPLVNLGSDTSICENSTLLLDAGNSGVTFLWNDGNTTSTQLISTAGTYVVTVTDLNNCKNTDSINVVVNNLPVVSINPVVDTVCIQAAPVTLSGNPPIGNFSGTGVSGSVFYPDSAGAGLHQIYYNFTDAANCSNSDSVSIYVDQCLAITINSNSEIMVYPNPAHDKIFIQKKSFNSDFHFTLRDITGKLLIEKNFISSKTTEQISTANFTKGIYFIEISTGGKMYNCKIMIE